MTLPRVARDSGVYFVRCQVVDKAGSVLAENVYWQSQQRDDLGDPTNDWAFQLKQVSWADMTALNWMPKVPLQVSARHTDDADKHGVTIRLQNPTQHVAFFERAEITTGRDDDEILPIEYSDNYVTVFPGETVEVHGVVPNDKTTANFVRVAGYNSPPAVVPIE
jgi:exo-1,4-beta-D-glucosaminidase